MQGYYVLAQLLLVCDCGSGRGEESSGGRVLPLIRIRLATPSFEKILLACQTNSPRARIADSSSRNAVSFSSARATKRFPLSRCASATKILRPLESIAETQPQLPTCRSSYSIPGNKPNRSESGNYF